VLTAGQQQELARTLEKIQTHFRGVYGAHGDTAFAMDVEFIVDHDRIRVLQARPWVDGG
jgi:phosphoenolpyruvate synthase/pyruvate phosphate dikinase